MKLRTALAIPLLAASLAHAAPASAPTLAQARAVFGFRIGMLCLAQDKAYENSPIARQVASDPSFKDWSDFESHPLTRCLRERKFVDKALCDDVMATLGVDPTPEGEVTALNAMLDRHVAVLGATSKVLGIEDVASKAGDSFNCPATVPEPVKTAP